MRPKTIKRILKTTAALTFFLLILAFAALTYILDDQPLVTAQSHQQIDKAESVSVLLQQLKHVNRKRYFQQSVMLSSAQINSLVGLLQRALPKFSGTVDISAQATQLQASYRLPTNPLGRYLNMQVTLLPGDNLQVDEVNIGGLSLPGGLVLRLLVGLVDWRTDSDIASLSVQQVERVYMWPSSMMVTLRPIDGLLKQLNEVKNGIGVGQNEALRQRTAHYLKFLVELPVDREDPRLSLATYMGPLFLEAKRRSTAAQAVEENEAAILALAIYTGHHRMANFVGEVQPFPGKVSSPRYRPRLAGRTDLTQHFVVSAAIQVLSQQGISAAIGEFKELMDRARGGSGYSFVDLAADMAGVKFATYALNPEHAARLQALIARAPEEQLFFPDIQGLPEGLSKREFVSRFGQVDSPAYRSKVEEIERKLDQLMIFTTPG